MKNETKKVLESAIGSTFEWSGATWTVISAVQSKNGHPGVRAKSPGRKSKMFCVPEQFQRKPDVVNVTGFGGGVRLPTADGVTYRAGLTLYYSDGWRTIKYRRLIPKVFDSAREAIRAAANEALKAHNRGEMEDGNVGGPWVVASSKKSQNGFKIGKRYAVDVRFRWSNE